MEGIISILKFLVSDKVIFPLFELLFLLFIVYAIVMNMISRRKGVGAVKRGEKSWNYFYLSYGIASVILMQIISVSESLKDYKVIISIVNLIFLLYLTFYNGWFRNMILGFIRKSRELKEIVGILR